MIRAVPLLAVFSHSGVAWHPSTYSLRKGIQGESFYDDFVWESIADPTHGRVNYVDQETSRWQNLTFATRDSFILRTDSTNIIPTDGPGRNSVRLRSKEKFKTHVSIFDVRHMPVGCGTWPAIWTVGENWPHGGEIDILEGVNDEAPNASTLHTGRGCTMPTENGPQTGHRMLNNCDASVNNNVGCPVDFPSHDSYGPGFNAAGGGWYVMERNDDFIKIWFWSRQDPNVPEDVKNPVWNVAPSNWGTPSAYFPGDSCNMSDFFAPHWIVINLTLCGDWAGTVYQYSNCPSTCVDHVNNNPWAFENAYFDIAQIRIYT
ncbi:endo-1,3(4)-beta-glucanase [Coprinopsis cinerea okayama7|uniref:Endo-1,3(4)-beta-glucanase n=1 Tax=Coprinopsis cinerea (strain Okayama-7 / 130 / ATCC MYA-4618 / FGSC 9003) TaxID=240176 RepID=A8PBB4_COPC7|nr:endo-1,3(4)-beta-glucanase [Coprinopsis cinerea okayama7\|eukprot:XP_001840141.1 endo-1,3(4)-beta-glucanase [Coprinopsis cinerea okayama7\